MRIYSDICLCQNFYESHTLVRAGGFVIFTCGIFHFLTCVVNEVVICKLYFVVIYNILTRRMK